MSDEEAPNSKNDDFSTDSEHNLTCCIFMLDILLKQMELQDVEQHMGIHTQVCQSVCRLLKCMVTAARVGVGSHVCAVKVKQVSECAYCEASIMWHQLSTKLVQFMAPENPIRPPDVSRHYNNRMGPACAHLHTPFRTICYSHRSRKLSRLTRNRRGRARPTRTNREIATFHCRWHRYQYR